MNFGGHESIVFPQGAIQVPLITMTWVPEVFCNSLGQLGMTMQSKQAPWMKSTNVTGMMEPVISSLSQGQVSSQPFAAFKTLLLCV